MNPLHCFSRLGAWCDRALALAQSRAATPARQLASVGLAMLLSLFVPAASAQPVACTPQISVTEQVADKPGGGFVGQYVMTTGDLCGLQVVALAVDNNTSLAAFANLSGWNAQVVTDNYWDAGIVLSRDDFGSGSSYRVTTGPAGIGSFVSFFGPYALLANVYWLSAHYGGPVLANSTAFTAVGTPIPLPDDAFQFETGAPASTPIVFLFDATVGTTVAVSVVPEPAAPSLLVIGLLGLLARRRFSAGARLALRR